MKKSEIYNIGRDFGINNNNIEKIILKNTNFSKSQLFLTDEINDNIGNQIIKDFNRFKNKEPIEYIINKAEFYSLFFYVDNRVLIPRNETEILVDKVLNQIIKVSSLQEENNDITLIDVGTGSGCIAISIMKNTQKIKQAYVIDISRTILKEITKKNINKHKLNGKIKKIKSNLLIKFLGTNDYSTSKNLIITANLPYIKTGDYKNMSPETIKYEPDLALYGGKKTGFELYKKLIGETQLLKKLNNINKLYLFIEIGFDQYDYSKLFLEKKGLRYKYYNDNNDIKRCIKITF